MNLIYELNGPLIVKILEVSYLAEFKPFLNISFAKKGLLAAAMFIIASSVYVPLNRGYMAV